MRATLSLNWKHAVACNIYISAGKRHAELLTNLLKGAQEQCRNDDAAVVVHAFHDAVYERSSFHLAGLAPSIATLAASVANQAIAAIDDALPESLSAHPNVGTVDHISVMPMMHQDDENDQQEPSTTTNPSGECARSIGERLQKNVKVLYYGSAHPDGVPLARVRRESTHFFGPNSTRVESSNICIVGAPLHCVENYNLRLSRACDKRLAQSLTRHVRERDGGLTGVEALTLQYGDCYEVACNLLRPDLVSSSMLYEHALEWQAQVEQSGNAAAKIERAYRVGTTAEQCRQALQLVHDARKRQEHDTNVLQQFQSYLTST